MAAKGRDPLWLLDFPRRLAAVPPGDVAAAARDFFAPGRFSGLVAADPGALACPRPCDRRGFSPVFDDDETLPR